MLPLALVPELPIVPAALVELLPEVEGERVVEPLMAPFELSELVEPMVVELLEFTEADPAAVAGVPPPITPGATPLRMSGAHSGRLRQLPVPAS